MKSKPRKVLIGWLAVFVWPLMAIVLSDFSPFHQFSEYLFIKGGSFLIVPSLIIAIPLISQLNFSPLSGQPEKNQSMLVRTASIVILLAALAVFLWYYCLFASIAIEINK